MCLSLYSQPVLFFSIRVTSQACVAIILVAVDPIVIIVGIILVVAGEATEYGVVIWIRMAVCALIPFSFVLATVNWKIEVVMIPVGRFPCVLCMTGLAGGWKLSRLVIRIIRLVVVALMTPITSVRCVVVIPVVTGYTFICYRRVRALQYIIVIMVRESRWVPVRHCCMTRRAFG